VDEELTDGTLWRVILKKRVIALKDKTGNIQYAKDDAETA
jgi:predicted transcriptional regulator